MILDTPQGRRVVRTSSGEWGTSAVPPPGSTGLLGSGWASWSAVPVRTADVLGLPVVAQCMSMICNSVGNLPMMVLRQEPNDQISRARRSWQWKLLHDHPAQGKTPFLFFSGITRDMLTAGNAYAFKEMDPQSGRVLNLRLLDPRHVRARIDFDTGDLNYFYTDARGKQFGPWDKTQLIHFVGEVNGSADEFGVGIIERHRQSLGSALAQEEYRAVFFRNGGNPGLVVKWPYTLSQQDLNDWEENWTAKHGGVHNAHRPTIVPGGAEVTKIGLTLEDMAFIEIQKFTVSEVARMFSVPPALLGQSDVTRPIMEDEHVLFTLNGLMPWIRRIEQTLKADEDMFGYGPLFPEFLADALLRPSTVARYQAYLQGRQAGWLSINDIRRMENMPPIAGGDQYQLTPVGGAPNLQNAPTGTTGSDASDSMEGRHILRLLEAVNPTS